MRPIKRYLRLVMNLRKRPWITSKTRMLPFALCPFGEAEGWQITRNVKHVKVRLPFVTLRF